MRIARSEVFAIFLMSTHIFSRDLRSRLEVGSSRIMNLASPINAIAIESFLLAPGDKYLTYLSISSTISTSLAFNSIHFSISAFFPIPLSLQTSLRCSLQVSSSNKKSFYWHNLTYYRNSLTFSRKLTYSPFIVI
jgi:hypothetical protein